MKLVMIGSGYVGLVSGACFADFGHTVICVDKDPAKIAALNAGQMPIYEPGLDHLVASGVAGGRLRFTTEITEAVGDADAVFIAVGTPSRRGDGHADMVFVHAAAREIAAALSGFTVVVNKSTVPVGTGDEVERIIHEANPQADFAVVSNPEFLREGAAIDDFKRPDRVVIGGHDERALALMREIYRPLALGRSPVIEMSRRGAELTKYAGNAFLATKITFINEMADLCEKVGADVQEVARGIGLDNRIGSKFLHAGPGYGGSCFPKDTLALLKTADDFASPLRIVEAVVTVNDRRKRAMGRKVIEASGGDVRGKAGGKAAVGAARLVHGERLEGLDALITEALRRIVRPVLHRPLGGAVGERAADDRVNGDLQRLRHQTALTRDLRPCAVTASSHLLARSAPGAGWASAPEPTVRA